MKKFVTMRLPNFSNIPHKDYLIGGFNNNNNNNNNIYFNNDMTFIVGGKKNNLPFLMVDCIVKADDREIFYDKVEKFSSCVDDTYFCQMGDADLKEFIWSYDRILEFRNEKIDVFNVKDVKVMFNEINNIIKISGYETHDYKEHCLFFISKSNIIKYCVKFDNKTKTYFNIYHVDINNNECACSNSVLTRDVDINIDLKSFCIKIINYESNNSIDFKDRFSFLRSDGNNIIREYPYKSEYDIINSFFRMGFDKIL